MPSTAKLFSAVSEVATHAFKPGDERTLCGLTVVSAVDYDPDEPVPPRSADDTGKRFYNGTVRAMCLRCSHRADRLRHNHEVESVPLDA